MPAKIVSLHNKAHDILYPDTMIDAVHMPDGYRTLRAELEEMNDGSCEIVFNNDGSITQTMTNTGMIITTEFGEADGTFIERCTYPDGTLYYTETTRFNNDGTITVSKVYADNSNYTPSENNEGGE